MKQEHERVAQYIAREILAKARGPRLDPDTWLCAGEGLRCLIASHRCDRLPVGQYFPPRQGGRGVIVHNRTMPDDLRCYVLVHELAHHVMAQESTGSLFGHVRCFGYHGSEQQQEMIARRVEAIVFPGHRRSARVRRFQE